MLILGTLAGFTLELPEMLEFRTHLREQNLKG
jgi:hypothetical protein